MAGAHRVAILADAHFHDIRGDFGGAGMWIGDERLALRPWADTRAAARAVNESGGALVAALDRIVAAGIPHVVLAGDYTDDGQAENTARLAALLAGYRDRHGIRFFAIPGNHDVYGPHGKHVAKRLATAQDKARLVTSSPEMAAAEPGAVLTPAMRCGGQPAALRPMAAFGLFRQAEDLHWESPFGLSDRVDDRMYDAVATDGSVSHRLMDASYLVEPAAGLWMLLIDANVFEPRAGVQDATRKKAFHDPSDAGWTALLRVKPFLLEWIADVAQRAARLGKVLVPVSHYPVLDPFPGDVGSVFGTGTIARRSPAPEVGSALIRAGLQFHAGGHLHINATTRMDTPEGGITDLSLPSLVAFPPGFKVLDAGPDRIMVETVSLGDVAPDPALTTFYAAEGRTDPALPLGPFLAAQVRAHLSTRRLPQDWPPEIMAELAALTVADLAARLCPEGSAVFATRHGLAEAQLSSSLTDLAIDISLLREGGRMALPHVPAPHLALCRALATLSAEGEVGVWGFMAQLLTALRRALLRIDGSADPEKILLRKI